MNSQESSRLLTPYGKKWCRLLALSAMWPTMIFCGALGIAGCPRSSVEVEYARSTKLPEELNGFMRLAQPTVKVNVIGTDKVGTFKTVEAASYLVLHEQDVAQLVRNTKELQELKAKK